MGRVKHNRQNHSVITSPEKPKVVLVTGWLSEIHHSAVPIVLRLVKILQPLSSHLTWVVTNLAVDDSLKSNTDLVRIRARHVAGALPKVAFYYLLSQIKIMLAMLKSGEPYNPAKVFVSC